MPRTYLLTCEHAGNEVPAAYEHLFKGREEVLYSHKAIDFGALRLARHIADETGLSLYYTTTSRLLVEANRSLDNEQLFSAYTEGLTAEEKQEILNKYYFPYRKKVERKVEAEVAAGNQVIHLAVHSFTPVLNGEVRRADIGILFDPERPLEVKIAHQLKKALQHQNPDREVLYNSPYLGTDDGLPSYLRGKFTDEQYAGFELEVNQKFFLHGKVEVWQAIMAEITAAWKEVMQVK